MRGKNNSEKNVGQLAELNYLAEKDKLGNKVDTGNSGHDFHFVKLVGYFWERSVVLNVIFIVVGC